MECGNYGLLLRFAILTCKNYPMTKVTPNGGGMVVECSSRACQYGDVSQQSRRMLALQCNMRLRTLTCILLWLFITLCACTPRKDGVLVLNEQRSINQAIADCKSRAAEGVPACTVDPSEDIKNFEAKFLQAFRAEPLCSEVTLVTLNASHNQRVLDSRRTSWLFLELSRGLGPEEKRFTVSDTDDPHAHGPVTSQGEAEFIAKNACDFVRNGPPPP